jgi:lysophospholipase L1-like esterase
MTRFLTLLQQRAFTVSHNLPHMLVNPRRKALNLATRFAAAATLALIAFPGFAQDHWVASWGAASLKGAGEVVPEAGATYRNIVHMSLGGKQVRLTLSNRFGAEPLTISGVSVARSTGNETVDAGSLRDVTFSGKPGTVIDPGKIVISDPVSIDVAPLSDVAVSIFLPAEKITFFTDHSLSHATNYRAVGNQIHAASLPGVTSLKQWRILAAIDVMAPAANAAIVAFGDSITDGQGTTNGANLRWPNQLAARLQADPKYAHLAVVNEGIGGNRILHDGGMPDARAGQHPSAMTRWSYDALERSGVKYIILLEGVNDIGHSSLIKEGGAKMRQEKSPEMPVTADDLIHAMTQLIDEAHAKGVKVIGATLTPYGGANYERPDGEEIHNAINEFIRHGGKFDGVIDFEKATQDPARPDRYRSEFNDKDHLHPNDAGAKAMADSVDLSIFK